ncbi:hypothetical protein ES703_57208 [subsurface metagenome]
MGAIKLGATAGRVRNLLGVARIYFKPSLGKFVIRKPGVIRRSEAVLARNRKIRDDPPAAKCKGLPWDKFVTCLAKEMPKSS